MTFDTSIYKLPNQAELQAAKVIYSDGNYDLMGYCEFDERDFPDHELIKIELIEELKNSLMDIFGKLENAERRILRKHGVNAMGKLNFKNFNHR